MRVLLIHPHDIQYHPWTIRIVMFAERLAARGHETTLAYIASREEWGEDAGARKGPARYVERSRVVPIAPLRGGRAGNPFDALAREADLVHIQKANPSTCLPALWAAYRARVPVHYDWDDNETGLAARSLPGLHARLVARWERALPRMADSVSVASAALREKALALGADPQRLADAPVGADLDRFRPGLDGARARSILGITPAEKCVLWAGQLEAADYADRFLWSARFVLAEEPRARFVVVGGGGRLESLQHMVEQYDAGKYVRFTGPISPHLMPETLAMADVAVAPLDDDEVAVCKSPLKIAEYMAMGLAVVSSEVGEAVTMLGGCGVLTPPRDEEALAKGILRYLKDPEKAAADGASARKRAEEKYNWEWSVGELERVYEG